jgi:DNA-binding NtrC family response regulator
LGIRADERDWLFSAGFPENRTLNDVTKDLKRALVQEALNRSGGNKVGAARLLGISRNSFNHYLATLNIDDVKNN